MKYVKYVSIFITTLLSILPFYVSELNNNLYYTIPASFVGSVCMFASFPYFANCFFRRSVYYSDLINKYADDKERWQRIFTRVNTVFSGVLVSFIVFYCIQKYRWSKILNSLDLSHGVSTEIIETLGIMSGIISLFKKWQVIFGKFFIKCIHRYKGRVEQSS